MYAGVRGIVTIILSVAVLAGCTVVKVYTESAEKNVLINTATRSGTLFSNVTATLHIYRVGTKCNADYMGAVRLAKRTVSLGIESEQVSLLGFVFERGGFLSSQSGRISYETLIRPRKGHWYEIDVFYQDAIYSVRILEKRSAQDEGRELPVYPLHECQRHTQK